MHLPHPRRRVPIFRQRGLLGIAASIAAALALPVAAQAATLVVDLDGTYDASTDDCTGTDPAYVTINAANTAAVDGDTIFVCPGTYVETQIQITKAITLQGSGAGSTIIDGGGGTGLASAGTIRIRTNTGDVTVDGFTIQNPSAQGAAVTGLRFGISAKSSAAVTYTITNNVIKGMNNPAWGSDYGVYTDGPSALETFVFQYNTVMETGSNPILIERHTGPTDVSYNTFDRGVYGGGISAYFNMSHSGDTISSLQRVSNNVIHMANDPGPYLSTNASGAITICGGCFGSGIGRFTNVEISGNTITGLEAYRRGISFVNNSAAPGTNGEISGAVVSCNQISGNATPQTGSVGIRMLGLVTSPVLSGNDISGVEIGFAGRLQNTHIATGITLNENSFSNIGLYGIDWWSTTPFDAERNWFDDASGPTDAGNPGGTGAAIGATGGPVGSPVVDYIPWLGSGADDDAGTCFSPADVSACSEAETCDPVNGCVPTPKANGDPCDDGLFCNGADTCDAGTCSAHTGDPCAAGGECADVCDEGADTCDVVAGTACTDDGELCSVDVCDGAGSCTHPAGNAGLECRAAGDVCELPAQCDGASVVCPANPAQPDGDSDGDCDLIDPCTNTGGQEFASPPKSRLVLAKINNDATPGNDLLTISGFFALPTGRTFTEIRPDLQGARVVLVADDGSVRLDATLPPDLYSPATKVGWRVSGNGKSWRFIDKTATPVSGITRFMLVDKDTPRAARRVKVLVSGKKGPYPVVGGDVPVQAIVTLGNASAAAAGLCGESAFSTGDCSFNPPGNKLVCRR